MGLEVINALFELNNLFHGGGVVPRPEYQDLPAHYRFMSLPSADNVLGLAIPKPPKTATMNEACQDGKPRSDFQRVEDGCVLYKTNPIRGVAESFYLLKSTENPLYKDTPPNCQNVLFIDYFGTGDHIRGLGDVQSPGITEAIMAGYSDSDLKRTFGVRFKSAPDGDFAARIDYSIEEGGKIMRAKPVTFLVPGDTLRNWINPWQYKKDLSADDWEPYYWDISDKGVANHIFAAIADSARPPVIQAISFNDSDTRLHDTAAPFRDGLIMDPITTRCYAAGSPPPPPPSPSR